MIQFYITESGVYNPAQITDPTQAFVIDIANKRLKLMETYTLEFQRLTDTYATGIDSSNFTGLSQKGANAMYKDLLGQIVAAAGVTPAAVSEQISSSLGPVNASITTINSSVDAIETKLGTIAEGAEVNVNPDWNATEGDASILNRPVLGSLAYKSSLDASEVGAVPTVSVGVANGIAQLDGTGKVPESQLPSYVDDVQEYNSSTLFPATGESGIIYVAKDDNLTYRWTGSIYVEISKSLALGETASTAYAGDKGKALKDAFDLHVIDSCVHVTDASADAWNDAASKKHEHSNKSVLDDISAEDVAGWDTAATDAHTHSNSGVLDGITDSSFHSHSNKSVLDGISAEDVTSWNTAATDAHTHSNSDVLNGITDSSFHTHTNKNILDGLTDTSVANWNDAETKAHEHSNKDVIDTITTTDVTNWIDASNAKHSHDNKTILDGIADSSFHTHTNKNILDGLTDTSVANWNDAETKAHEHTNKSILDGITDSSIADWMGGNVQADWNATSGDASILNRPILGTAAEKDFTLAISSSTGAVVTDGAIIDYVAGAMSSVHTHANKDLLDGITDASFHTHSNKSVLDNISSDDIANWDDASNNSHSHDNIDILDGLTDTSVANWNIAYTNNHTHSNADILNGITDTSIADFIRDTSYGLGSLQDLTLGTSTTPMVWDASVINAFLAFLDTNAVRYKGDIDAGTGDIVGTQDTLTTVSNKKGDVYVVSTEGTLCGVDLQVGDSIIFKKNVAKNTAPVATDLTFVQGTVKVTNENATLQWNTSTKIATVEGVDIYVKIPENPTANYGNVVTKDYTDTISASTGALVTDGAVKAYVDDTISQAHSHSNKALLDSIVDSSFHTHANKDILDGFTDTSIANWNTAYTNNHTHANGGILDGITDSSVANWNTAYGWGDHSTQGYATQTWVNTSLGSYATNARVAEVSTYVQNVSTYAANVSTRLATTNTNVTNVSTYAANVSTNTASRIANVSTYAANVSTNLATFKNNVSTLEDTWAAAWNQLFARNPSLVRP